MKSIVTTGPANDRHQDKKLWLDAALPPLALQHVWYEMKQKGEWRSIALLPVTDDIQTLGVAHGLGLMAVREPHDGVWIVNASSSASDHIHPEDMSADRKASNGFPYKYVDLTCLGINQEKQLFTAERLLDQFTEKTEANMRLIFAVDSVVSKTHAISLCRSVDTVMLCIALGRTSFKSVRRTVEIVGRDRIIGSIVLHPKANN